MVRAASDAAAEPDEIVEADLYALVTAFRKLLRETGEETTVAVARERLPITHFVGIIFERLVAAGGSLSFADLVGGKPDRSYLIGAFLALLELVKLRKVRVVQEIATGDIEVKVHEDAMQPEGAVDRDLATARRSRRASPRSPRASGSSSWGRPRSRCRPSARSAARVWRRCSSSRSPTARPVAAGVCGPTAVALAAEELNLAVLHSADVNARDARDEIGSATPDVIVTAGFGQKLGGTLLALPPGGCVNVHASLLPLYRGASPIAAAIRDGQRTTGVTLFQMDAHLDRGPVIASVEVPIGPDDTLDDVSSRMAEAGADLLVCGRSPAGWRARSSRSSRTTRAPPT